MSQYRELNLEEVRTYSALSRKSKIGKTELASVFQSGQTFREWAQTLPNVLKVQEIKAVAGSIVRAREKSKPVLFFLGGHVVKCGCIPVLIDLANRGFITHFAVNGSVAVHDSELTLFGQTSEDVAQALSDGSFGMARETAQVVNAAAVRAHEEQLGFGEALGREIMDQSPDSSDGSLFAFCLGLEIPVTVHVALGTDIVHQHPSAEGACIGDASMRDFRILAASVSELGNGGVVVNVGSAVILPEVFLKALSVARNLKGEIADFTTANFDMIQHYRPMANVVQRPVIPGGRGYAISGHHEIMLPLLAALVLEEQARS